MDRIVVAPRFESVWPAAVDHLAACWRANASADLDVIRAGNGETVEGAVEDPGQVERLVALGVPVADPDLPAFTALDAAFVTTDSAYHVDEVVAGALADRGVTAPRLETEGFWAQSVAEVAVALTIDALRHLPQKYAAMQHATEVWDMADRDGPEGFPGHQHADHHDHVAGTVAGKRVRLVGVGNIGSRYADAVAGLGADVVAADPYADEPCFHRAGARQARSIDALLDDADVFAPVVPLTDETRGLVSADQIDALPTGCLVLLVTRAPVVDVPALRERVLSGELALAADVWDTEPLPLDDPLLGRDNVVHTPHLAGRTLAANERFAERIAWLLGVVDVYPPASASHTT